VTRPPNTQKVVSVRLDAEKYEALKALAESEYRTLTLELRLIIDRRLAEGKRSA